MSPAPLLHNDHAARNLGWLQASISDTISSPSATDSAEVAAASMSTANSSQQQDWGLGGNKSQILNWAAIAVVVGLMLAIAGWRLATLRNRSLKGFFLPKGLKIKWLGIDIKPPPPPPAIPTLSEVEQQRRQRRAEERFQRRRTRGDDIGEGGQRQDGARYSEDGDNFDTESLPGYKADISAPIYLEEWRVQAEQQGTIPAIDPETEDAIRESGPVLNESSTTNNNTSGTDGNDEGVMSVAEYEARQRGDTVADQVGQTTERAQDSESSPHASYPPETTELTHPPTSQNPMLAALRRPPPARTNSTRSSRSTPPNYDNLSRVPSRLD